MSPLHEAVGFVVMVVVEYYVSDCTFTTENVSEALAIAPLTNHE